MTILKSYWVLKTETIGGQRWYWICGIMECNMLNSLCRIAGPQSGLKIKEVHEDRWEASLIANPDIRYTVYRSEEQPEIEHPKFTTIYDHRPRELAFAAKKKLEPDRSGMKKVPAQISFGF